MENILIFLRKYVKILYESEESLISQQSPHLVQPIPF